MHTSYIVCAIINITQCMHVICTKALMTDNDLKTKYEYFLENLNLSYDLGIDLCNSIKDYLTATKENHNLEWQLFYLTLFLEQLENTIEKIEKTIYFKKQKTKEKIKNNLIIIPLYPDKDIYVSEDVNIKDIFKS